MVGIKALVWLNYNHLYNSIQFLKYANHYLYNYHEFQNLMKYLLNLLVLLYILGQIMIV